MFSLESPHQGDSNEYTQHTILNIKKENHPKLSQLNFKFAVKFAAKSNGIFPRDSRMSSKLWL